MERRWDACESLNGQLLLSAAGSLWCWRMLKAGAARTGAGGGSALCLCCSKGLLPLVVAVSPREEPLGASSLWLH